MIYIYLVDLPRGFHNLELFRPCDAAGVVTFLRINAVHISSNLNFLRTSCNIMRTESEFVQFVLQ